MPAVYRLSLAVVLVACATPDLGTEIAAFSSSVDGVAADYETAVGITPGSIRAAQTAALVADRTRVLQLDEGCEAYAAAIPGFAAEACILDQDALVLAEGSPGQAAALIARVRDYIAALKLLASAETDGQVGTGAAALIDAFGKLASAAPSEALTGYVAELKAREAGITRTLSFAARQYRYRLLRRITAEADEPLRRIVLSLTDAATARGEATVRDAARELIEAQAAMDEAKLDGTDAEYGAAIEAFLAAHERFRAFGRTGLTARLRLIAETHSALAARLRRPAGADEIVALVEQLKAIDTAF
jgi:hypothetical protein